MTGVPLFNFLKLHFGMPKCKALPEAANFLACEREMNSLKSCRKTDNTKLLLIMKQKIAEITQMSKIEMNLL